MSVVTVSSLGDVIAQHLDYQSLSQLILMQTSTWFFLSGHSHSVLGSLLTVVSLLYSLTVPYRGRPVRRVLVVKMRKLESVDAIPPA